MATKIQVRRGTAAEWTSANPTLAEGEPGLETDTGLEKRGDGATAWTALAYHLPKQIHGVAGKTTPVDADEFGIIDTAASNALKKLTFANLLATIWTRLGALIAGGTDKATPADADTLGLADSAASSATKKLTFANLWIWVKAKVTALTAKATPVDADSVLINDSEASGVPKQTTLTNFKAFLKTYFDGIYGALANTPDLAGKGAADDIGDASGASTAAKILALVESVGGAGSGLDADLLDGQHASFFTNLDNLSGGATYARTTIVGAAAANDIGGSTGVLIKDKLITAIAASAAGTSMLRATDAAAQRALLSVEENADVTDAANVGAAIHGAAAKTTPIDADTLAGINSASSNVLTKFTFANLWVWVQAKIAAASSKTTPVDADSILGVDSEASSVSKRFTFANLGTWIWTKLGALIAGGTSKVTPLDADTLPLSSAADTNATRKLLWSNLKATMAAALIHGGSNEISTATPAENAIPKATAGSKLDGWISDATALVKGLMLLGAVGGAVKDTKMPDGATAVSGGSQDAWATVDGWSNNYGTLSVAAESGWLRVTASSTNADMLKDISGIAGKTLAVRIKASKSVNLSVIAVSTLTVLQTIAVGVSVSVYLIQLPANATRVRFLMDPCSANDWFAMDWFWVGDYSYLAASLSEEAARIVNQIGDSAGLPVAASATITSNTTNVNVQATGIFTTDASLPVAGATFSVNGTLYTWVTGKTPNTEGEVLIGATVADCLTNAKNAVNGDAGTKGTTHFCTANAYATAAADATKITVTAILRGTVGNAYTLAVSGTACHLTISAGTMGSGAGATAGVDDTVTVAGKAYKFVGQTPANEGEVKVGSGAAVSLANLADALNRRAASVLDGSSYKVAARHPLVYSTYLGAGYVMSLFAGVALDTNPSTFVPNPGELGNQITLAKSATTLTLSGATFNGGVSDASAKIKALVEQNSNFDIPLTTETALLTTLLGTTGANLAAKLAAATAAATTSEQGVVEFATAAEIVAASDDTRAVNVKQLRDAMDLAGMFIMKRTKMPDGGTALYSQDAWSTTDTWGSDGSPSPSVAGGVITFKYNLYKTIASIYGKTIILRIRCTSGNTTLYVKAPAAETYLLATVALTQNQWTNVSATIPAAMSGSQVLLKGGASDVFEIDWVWVGDPDATTKQFYLAGSLSEEATRIIDRIGDSQGTGVAASGTISAGTGNFAVDDTVTIGGKAFTAKDTTANLTAEGHFLISDTLGHSIENLNRAINRTTPATYDKSVSGSDPRYYCTVAHTLVSSAMPGATINLSALLVGETGNYITLATSVSAKAVLSGATLTGGISDAGAKLSWLVSRSSQLLAAKTTLTTADYITLLDAADGLLKKKITVANLLTTLAATTDAAGFAEQLLAAEILAGSDTTRFMGAKGLLDSLALDGMWIPRRVKFPDGATGAEYNKTSFGTTDTWSVGDANSSLSAVSGKLALAITGGASAYRLIRTSTLAVGSGFIGIEINTNSNVTKVEYYNGTGWVELTTKNIGATFSRYYAHTAIAVGYAFLQFRFTVSGNTTINTTGIYYGIPSYLFGSISEEGERIATQVADATGVGKAAGATILSNHTNVTDGDTVTIAGKTYIFKTTLSTGPTVEGEVLKGAIFANTLDRLAAAINHTGTPGTDYTAAAAHPLVWAQATLGPNYDMVWLYARTAGALGNQLTLAKSAVTITLSGSTFSGGYSDAARKIQTISANANGDIALAATDIGFIQIVDAAIGATTVPGAAGTWWLWEIPGSYGATIGSAKRGKAEGGTSLTVAGANATIWYQRTS